jgi:hypothetical protein
MDLNFLYLIVIKIYHIKFFFQNEKKKKSFTKFIG